MSGGYRVPATDALEALYQRLDAIQAQILELQRPDGGQIAGALAKVNALIGSLPGLVNAYLASGFTTGSMTASTDITSNGTGSVAGIFKNAAAYSNPITVSFRSVWTTSVDGQYGFNLSSREFKEDIFDFAIDPLLASKLRVVTFRYIEAVELLGDDAATEVGLIAEEVEELAPWLVEHNPETGKPEGIKFHLLALPALSALNDLDKRVKALEAKA